MSFALKRLVLVRGLPGDGKTTLAIKAFKNEGYVHVETDHYFHNNGVYKFDQAKINDAHEHAIRKMCMAIESGNNVVVCNNFIRAWELKEYIAKSGLPNKDILIIHAQGGTGNNKGINDYNIERMRYRWQEWKGEKKLKIDPSTLNTPKVRLIRSN